MGLTIALDVPEQTGEVAHGARLLALPVRIHSRRGGTFAATVSSGAFFEGPRPDVQLPGSTEGFVAAPGEGDCLHIVSSTARGLANGVYELRRRILVRGPEALRPCELLPRGEHSPRFEQRDCYHYLSPWRLAHLSCDSLTLEEWKVHLQRMRALNVNRVYVDIWTDQYYHPDFPETRHNQALYDRIKAALDYARELGLRTGLYLFPAQVPVSVYLAHPGARAVEAANYHGINACPSKAWDLILPFDTFLLSYFGSSVDDVMVEFQDPGSCVCEECCRNFPELVLRFMEAYRRAPGGPSDRCVDLCTLHFRDWLEAGAEGVASPVDGLCEAVFSKLPAGTTISDIDYPTLEMGRRMGLKANYFFFDLDPESGLEDQQVFPRVQIRRIESQVRRSAAHGHTGLSAYRMMPFAQFPADYVLFRKCWDPGLESDTILRELAAEYGLPPASHRAFAQAMRDLDAWRGEGDAEALQAAHGTLERLGSCSDDPYFTDLCDQVAVLRPLVRYLVENRSRVEQPDFYPPPELVDSTRERMVGTRIFEAFTAHQHWVLRSREIVGQHIRWWLMGLVGGLNP